MAEERQEADHVSEDDEAALLGLGAEAAERFEEETSEGPEGLVFFFVFFCLKVFSLL